MPYWLILALGLCINGVWLFQQIGLVILLLNMLFGNNRYITFHLAYFIGWFAMIFYWSYVLYH